MRGDLVYEKIGEIDPALLADALPGDTPSSVTAPFNQPGIGRLLRMTAIAACILLGGLLLVGGGVALSRIPVNLWGTEPVETQSPPPVSFVSPDYEGAVSFEGLDDVVELDLPAALGEEIKRFFNEAIPQDDVCECERDQPIRIGDHSLTYCRSHGCFRDSDTGIVYLLSSEGKAFMDQVLGKPEIWKPVYFIDFVYSYRRHGDDYMFSIQMDSDAEFIVFEIKDIYLRYLGDDAEYRTQDFHTVLDLDMTYFITVPEEAPYGDYELVVHLYSPYTGRNIEMDISSGSRAVTVIPAEREPAYEFDYACDRRQVTSTDDIEIQVYMTNLGDDIYRWSRGLSIHPSVTLSTTKDGEYLEFPMGMGLELEWYGNLYCLDTYERSEATFRLNSPDQLPPGTYDLIVGFEGCETVFPTAIEIVETTIESP